MLPTKHDALCISSTLLPRVSFISLRHPKGRATRCDATRELAAVFNELDDENEVESGGNEDGGDGNSDEDDDTIDDDNDGLPDEQEGLKEEELVSLDDSVKPIRLMSTKVSQFKLLFIR